jgi:hypothetical protein
MNTGTRCSVPAAPGCTVPRTYLGQYTGGTVKLRNGATVITASSSGFGGLRKLLLQCTSPSGSYVTRAETSGVFDILSRNFQLVWTVGAASPAYTASCRAVVTSKAARLATASVPLVVGS